MNDYHAFKSTTGSSDSSSSSGSWKDTGCGCLSVIIGLPLIAFVIHALETYVPFPYGYFIIMGGGILMAVAIIAFLIWAWCSKDEGK